MPLDRTGKVGGTLKLQVLTAGRPDAPRGTLLFLTGGPGRPGVSIAPTIRKRLPKALAEYRLVMIDQRGTGAAAIDCPALQSEAGSSDTVAPTAGASAPLAGRETALDRAVRRIEPGTVWPFEPRTAGEQGMPQTCLPWPASRPGASVPDRKLSMPVLLLSGDRDLSTPPAWARQVAAEQPRARLTVIGGAGHSTQSRSDGGAKAAQEFLLR
ncbi:alpha/beta fold hydrolase [Streptomyces sp. NPDC057136]|uniref:alpha/beta fold hydrolase n=1 Tax=Streptomyces sp. NPDC057136 TaxID=3346029 RepID=UPI0036424AB0